MSKRTSTGYLHHANARFLLKQRAYAYLVAQILERMTGDRCQVVTRHGSHHDVLRISGEKVGRG